MRRLVFGLLLLLLCAAFGYAAVVYVGTPPAGTRGVVTNPSLQTGGGGGGAATTNHYVTTQAETDLTAEFNLGLLSPGGMLKLSVTGGVGTPQIAVPGTDFQAPLGFTPVPDSRTLAVLGTAGEIQSSIGGQDLTANRTWTLSLPPALNLTTHALRIPNATTVPASCTVGELYFDTDATAGQNIYGCTASNTWTLQAGGGGGGGAPTTGHYLVTQSEPTLTSSFNLGGLSSGLLKLNVSGGIATPQIATPGTDFQAPFSTSAGLAGVLSDETGFTTGAVAVFNTRPTILLQDSLTTFQDDGDTTRQARFELGQLTTGTLRTYTLPDANTTLVGTGTPQTLTNKTVDWGSNTVSMTLAQLNTAVSDANVLPEPATSGLVARTGAATTASRTLQAAAGNNITVTNGNGVAGDPTIDVGSNVAKLNTSNAWADGVRQTFNPNGTVAGLNVGSQPGDPTTLLNGDLWYDPLGNALKAYINGAVVNLGSPGGLGDVTDVGTCTGPACFTDTFPGGRLTFTPQTTPATPAAGEATLFVSASPSKNLALLDDAGVIKHGVQTLAPVSGQFVTGIGDDGIVSKAAPTQADVGLSNVTNKSEAQLNSATVSVTNHQIVPRVTLCSATPNISPNADTTDVCYNYSLAAPALVNNPTATGSNPVDQQRLELVFRSAAPQALTWGSKFTSECGLPLPTGTTGDGITYNHYLFRYSTTSTNWCLLASTRSPARLVSETTVATVNPTLTCNADTFEQCNYALTGAAGTVTLDQPGGTPTNAQMLVIGLRCPTAAQALGYHAIFIPSRDVPLPTTCPLVTGTGPWMELGFMYSSALTKWQLIASTEATTGGTGALTVEETDGTPTGVVTTLRVTPGTLTIAGSVATLNVPTGAGTGDVIGPSGAADGEVALFSGTTGKLLKRATGNGLVKLTAGVQGTANPGVDFVAPATTITATPPLTGGGDLSANRTIGIADAAADGTTKGAATFAANDFNATAGLVSLDYTNGQKATGSVPGFLSQTDWSTFSGKQNALSGTTGGVVYFSAPSTPASSGALSSNQLVLGSAVSGVSTPVGLGTAQAVLHGNAAGAPSWGAVTLGGDVTGTLPRANGGLGSSTPGTGLLRDGTTPAASELTGDATTSGSNNVTVARVNGVNYAASPATDTVPVVTAVGTATYKAIPDCDETTPGQHLNYDTATHAWSCGTSSSFPDPGVSGLVVRTGPGTTTARSLQGTGNNIAVSNQDGTSGNPQIDVGSNIAKLDTPNAWGAGVKQTFTPTPTTAGLNVGIVAGNPATLTNGDLWYDTTASVLKVRQNGVTTALGPTGSSGQVQFTTTTGFGATAGLTVDNTTIVGRADRITTIAASKTPLDASDGPVIACTSGASDVTLTLPAAASTPSRHYTIVKVDSGAGRCLVKGNGTETLNGSTNTLAAGPAQRSRVDVDLDQTTGTPNWSGVTSKTAIDLAADVGTSRLPYANLTAATAASRLLGRGSASAGDWQELTLTPPLSVSGTALVVAAASTGASGVASLATAAETTTGTDATKVVTPDGLAGSDYGKRYITMECVPDTTPVTTGTGKCYFPLHPDFNGWNIVGSSAHVGAVIGATSGLNVDIQRCGAVATGIRCSGSNVSVFSTVMTIDVNEDGTETGNAGTINAANQALSTGQWLRVDVSGTFTATQGLYVTMVLQKP